MVVGEELVSSGNLQQLADQLRADRLRAGLSMRALAEKSGVSHTAIVRLETAQVETPKPDALKRLAAALGSDVEEYYAHVGYLVPTSLPELRPYLRQKYNLPEQAAEQIDEVVQALRHRWSTQPLKENDNETGDKAA